VAAIEDGGARGLREPKAVALQAKRVRLAGRRNTFTPLGSLPHSFLMRIRQRTPPSGRQGNQCLLALPLKPDGCVIGNRGDSTLLFSPSPPGRQSVASFMPAE